MRALGIKKILVPAIVFLIISVLISFGLTSNQAFAGDPSTCEDCQALRDLCDAGSFFDLEGFEQCLQPYMDCSARLCRAIGGDMIQIETTSVLAAGAQYTAAWMIPVIVSGIGIAIVIARKF